MQKTLTSWVKKAFETFVDPEREERFQTLVQVLQNGLQIHRQDFVLTNVLQGVDYTAKDLELAKDHVYREILSRGWGDGRLSRSEQEVANWVAGCLELPAQKARESNVEFARAHFATALAKAMEDGVLDENEESHLREIAASVGATVPQFVRQFFRSEGESFLRGIFLACIADNHLSHSEWTYLLQTTQRLGISREELLQAVQPQAQRFVEHVLADAKSDGRLSQNEDATLRWLIGNLGLSPQFRQYIEAEVAALRLLTDIADGKLPSLAGPAGVAVRAGEIVHFHAPAVWRHVRMLASGPRTNDHHGTLTLTDNRLIFSSPSKSQSTRYRSVVAHRGGLNWIEVQVEGKPISSFFFASRSPILYVLFQSAIALANQTLVAKTLSANSRHIPRDVRQRVWQRYGARCAECGAEDYLEYDHIIPVAKGGSNSDANVQLLCRRCNLKKSDHI